MQLTKWNSCLNSNYFREKPAADAGPNVQTSLIRFCSGYVVQVVVEQIHSISMSQDVDLLLAPQQITNKSKQWSFGFNLLWTGPQQFTTSLQKKSTINPQQVRNTQQVLQHVVQQSTTKSNKWSLEISQQVRRIMEDEDLKVDSNDTLIIIIIIVVVVILFLNN